MCYMRHRVLSTVGVRELRQNLSLYLERVKKGEALTVTEHGRAVATLRPLAGSASILDRLVSEGRAKPPTRSHRNLPRPVNVKLDWPVSQLLDELRADRL
jgi:prevent-host-death family protein